MTRITKTLLFASMVLSLGATDALAQRGRSGGNGNSAQRQRQTRNRAGSRRQPVRQNQAGQDQRAYERTRSQQLPAHMKLNGIKLSGKDMVYLTRTASSYEGMIRYKLTPRVDLRIATAGVQVVKTSKGKGPNIFEVTGASGLASLDVVMSGAASGHVMQKQYGGRSIADVEKYGKEDIVHLTHKKPGATQSEHVIQTQSRGLVTQEGFRFTPTKGTHNFFYFRTAPTGGGSGGEGTEPELRHVQLIIK